MNIGAGANSIFATQHPQATNSVRGKSEVTSVALTTSSKATENDAAGVTRTDFTSMTRQEMRDWLNDQIRSGKLPLDDSMPFMAMTLKIPAGGGGDLPVAGDDMRYDFMQRARDGIDGARSRGDQAGWERLEKAMAVMQQYQGQISSVDVLA